MTERTSKPIRFFPPEFSRMHNKKKFRLTAAELDGVSPSERALLEIMADVYSGGTIMGIENYSGGCSYPNARLNQTLDKYQKLTGNSRRTNLETFVFSMYGASYSSNDFIKRHSIATASGNGLPEIANHVTQIAEKVPNSEAFCEEESEGIKFGFTLSGKAARAMHKMNQAVNPICRGAGD